ncbi:MAG TPA: polyprenyl synthetase family protein [Candidatus Competibacter sp.]|nr:polyprenyl synthetase family protein [Candidatus Competibacter sp.]
MSDIGCLPVLPSALEHKLQHPLTNVRSAPVGIAKDVIHGSSKFLAELLSKHLGTGGQRVRARLAWNAACSLKLNEQTGMALACCCEWLHNASLIHDDIQDGDMVRRDKPALWVTAGLGSAICAGDALIAAAYGVLREVQVSPDRLRMLLELVEEAIRRTVTGQLADLSGQQTVIRSLVTYEGVAADKAGPLLSLPLTLALSASSCSGERQDMTALADLVMTHLGIAYQLLDDLRDWNQDRRADGRQIANAVLIQLQHCPSTEAAAAVSRRARQRLREAEKCAAALPSGLRGLIDWLIADLESQLNVV